jgi:hypothetical protein
MYKKRAIFSDCGHEIEKVTHDMSCPVCTLHIIERLQAKIDAAIEEACDTQPSWEWRCYAMAKALGANFDKPSSRYGKEGDLQARVDALDAELQIATFIIRGLYSGPHTNISLAKAKKWLAEKDDDNTY